MCSKDDTQNVELDEGAQEILRMLRSERICARRRGVGGRILSNAHIASGVLQVLVTDERDMPKDMSAWARRRLRKLKEKGYMREQAGCPGHPARWFITCNGEKRSAELEEAGA